MLDIVKKKDAQDVKKEILKITYEIHFFGRGQGEGEGCKILRKLKEYAKREILV